MNTKQIINDLLVTAFEGGSNYWYNIVNDYYSDVYDSIINKGCIIKVADIETNKILGNISYDKCVKVFNSIKNSHTNIYLNIINESYDVTDADIFLQIVVMNEVIYG